MWSFSAALVFSLSTLHHNKMFPLYLSAVTKGRQEFIHVPLLHRAYFEFRTSASCCSWCFTISIENERRSGGTCRTTYWIIPVWHEITNAELAPMPLAMPFLVPRCGGDSVACHEHRAKGG
ncbi:hypothetical protein V6N11_034413 [Hibiscus sabdariffa]|uniref:Secreted protein n=1 Tax=Hibiscus sabdariffa TaxID=183260 RepID=A0ABR2NMK5_9ROSI